MSNSKADIFEVQPALYKDSRPVAPLRVVTVDHKYLTPPRLNAFLVNNILIGLAGEYKSGRLVQLVLATPSDALIVQLATPQRRQNGWSKHILSDVILSNPGITLIAFNFDRLALALHCDMDTRINSGVDLLSLLPNKSVRGSGHSVASIFGNVKTMNISKIADIFQDEKQSLERRDRAVLRAWSACHAAHLEHLTQSFAEVKRIDTVRFNKKHLDFLAKRLRDSFRLEALKPTIIKNDISEHVKFGGGGLQVESSRYKTRLRISGSQTLRVAGGKENTVHLGRVIQAQGRQVTIATDKSFRPASVRSITTIGKEEPTSAESQRAEIILWTLQGRISLFENPIISRVWFASDIEVIPKIRNTEPPRPPGVDIPLNFSQIRAVNEMLRLGSRQDAVQLTMIHGPPGSGKTSVATGFVKAIQCLPTARYGEAVYLTAQSNVAVKNIAEKLAKTGFRDWKLIVSHDFHFDWHEHLYENIVSNVIESSNLPFSPLATARMFGGARAILCTLSMLSNTRLGDLTRLFPPKTLVVDEASQIEVGDYLPVFHTFRETLRQLCFVGDDKQLPPFGQNDIHDLQSIFEIGNLRRDAIFLNIQYRMPMPIGRFISQSVYGGKLCSSHPIKSKDSCRFVDVANGKEIKHGHSWKNAWEVHIVVHLVKQARAKGESPRVITPYDAQRNEIETALKLAKLPWENRCFNCDSFQGNEADDIIISLVRTGNPGFLKSERRTNVLLTRCKKRMTICSHRGFLEKGARKTLVGKMAAYWGPNAWVSWQDVVNGRA